MRSRRGAAVLCVLGLVVGLSACGLGGGSLACPDGLDDNPPGTLVQFTEQGERVVGGCLHSSEDVDVLTVSVPPDTGQVFVSCLSFLQAHVTVEGETTADENCSPALPSEAGGNVDENNRARIRVTGDPDLADDTEYTLTIRYAAN